MERGAPLRVCGTLKTTPGHKPKYANANFATKTTMVPGLHTSAPRSRDEPSHIAAVECDVERYREDDANIEMGRILATIPAANFTGKLSTLTRKTTRTRTDVSFFF
jgi:hypothetical protein